MLRLLISLCLIWLCIAQEDLHLKIAEKLAIPHYTRHAYDYPAINFNRLMAGAQGGNRGPQGAGGRQGFSQPDPFNQPASPVRQPEPFNQPLAPVRQPEPFNQPLAPVRQSAPIRPQQSFSSQPNQPVRQTRFFNLYTPSNRPEFRSQFGLDRRES